MVAKMRLRNPDRRRSQRRRVEGVSRTEPAAQYMESRDGRIDNVLTVAIAGALAAPLAAQAVDVSVSGHVNRALVVPEEGDATFGDGTNSGTRFRIRATGEEMDGLTAGVNLEWGVKDGNELTQRHRNLWVKGTFGEVKVGHTSEAADFVAYQDKSGVHVGHGKQGAVGTYTHGGGRSDGLHYSSPSVGLGRIHMSVANGDRLSGTLEVSNASEEEPTLSYKAALGYLDANDAANPFAGIGGAIGVKHISGITASFSAGTISYDDDTMDSETYMQGVLGYVIGSSAVAVGVYNADSRINAGEDMQVVGFGVKHTLKAGVELYATAHNSDHGMGTEEGNFVLGAKVSF